MAHDDERTRWKVLDERVVDENPLLRLSMATVELPDGTVHPIAGTADTAYELYLARGADHVGTPDPNETEAIRWIPLTELPSLITKGEISGAATIIGVQHALLTAGQGHR